MDLLDEFLQVRRRYLRHRQPRQIGITEFEHEGAQRAMRMASAEGKMWGVSYLTPDRFRDTLRLSGIEQDDLVDEMADTYWRVFHGEPATFDDAEETLQSLKGRYTLGMITNGHADGLAFYYDVIADLAPGPPGELGGGRSE